MFVARSYGCCWRGHSDRHLGALLRPRESRRLCRARIALRLVYRPIRAGFSSFRDVTPDSVNPSCRVRSPGLLGYAVAAAFAALSSAAVSIGQTPDGGGASHHAETGFRVAVLLSTTRHLDDGDFARVFARAADILQEKTGERLVQTAYVDVGPGRAIDIARRYVNAHADGPPDGVIVLSDDQESRQYGGYSETVELPGRHVNRFPSPFEGERRAYVAVVDFFHLYAKCGYDSRLKHVSPFSRGGECRGVEGLLCVDNGPYWTCPDSTMDLNADREYFIASVIVHEFIHPFGRLGDEDHYGTPQCRARTGMTSEGATDRRLSQENLGMCPDLFPRFRRRGP